MNNTDKLRKAWRTHKAAYDAGIVYQTPFTNEDARAAKTWMAFWLGVSATFFTFSAICLVLQVLGYHSLTLVF